MCSGDVGVQALRMYLKAMELHVLGSKQWAEATAAAFDVLKTTACDEEPKPDWWNDAALKGLSVAASLAAASEEAYKADGAALEDLLAHVAWGAEG